MKKQYFIKSKKIVSLLLALALVMSLFCTAFSTTAFADPIEITPENMQLTTFRFIASNGFENYSRMCFYVWDQTDGDIAKVDKDGKWWINTDFWGSKKISATQIEGEENVYEYSIPIPEGHEVYLIVNAFNSSPILQTCNLLITPDADGDEIYLTGNMLENPVNPSGDPTIEAKFRNTDKCGAVKVVTSTCKVQGTVLKDDPAQMLAKALSNYYTDTQNWTRENVLKAEEELNVTDEEVLDALREIYWDIYNFNFEEAAKLLSDNADTDTDTDVYDTDTDYTDTPDYPDTDTDYTDTFDYPDAPRGTVKFRTDGDIFGNDDDILFYIWDANEYAHCTNEGWIRYEDPWFSFSLLKGTKISDDTFESYEFSIPEGHEIMLVIHDADNDEQTCDVIMTPDSFGDTLYLTGNTYDNPVDSEKITYEALCENTPQCGPAMVITPRCTVAGTVLRENHDYAYDIAIKMYTSRANGYGDTYFNRENVADVISGLNVTPDDVWQWYLNYNYDIDPEVYEIIFGEKFDPEEYYAEYKNLDLYVEVNTMTSDMPSIPFEIDMALSENEDGSPLYIAEINCDSMNTYYTFDVCDRGIDTEIEPSNNIAWASADNFLYTSVVNVYYDPIRDYCWYDFKSLNITEEYRPVLRYYDIDGEMHSFEMQPASEDSDNTMFRAEINVADCDDLNETRFFVNTPFNFMLLTHYYIPMPEKLLVTYDALDYTLNFEVIGIVLDNYKPVLTFYTTDGSYFQNTDESDTETADMALVSDDPENPVYEAEVILKDIYSPYVFRVNRPQGTYCYYCYHYTGLPAKVRVTYDVLNDYLTIENIKYYYDDRYYHLTPYLTVEHYDTYAGEYVVDTFDMALYTEENTDTPVYYTDLTLDHMNYWNISVTSNGDTTYYGDEYAENYSAVMRYFYDPIGNSVWSELLSSQYDDELYSLTPVVKYFSNNDNTLKTADFILDEDPYGRPIYVADIDLDSHDTVYTFILEINDEEKTMIVHKTEQYGEIYRIIYRPTAGFSYEELVAETYDTPEPVEAESGDLDGDSVITANDALMAMRISVGMDTELTDEQLAAADVDGDGIITTIDAVSILRFSLGRSYIGNIG